MSEPLLTDIFGAGATQTADTLHIPKSGLSMLTALADNTAESLLAAILLTASARLSPLAATKNPAQNIIISNAPDTLVSIGGVNSYRTNRLIGFRHPNDAAGIMPDDY
jgi:hypothetical protein